MMPTVRWHDDLPDTSPLALEYADLQAKLAAALEREKTVAPGHAVLAGAIAEAREEARLAREALAEAERERDRVSKLWNEARMKLPKETAGWRAIIKEKETQRDDALAALRFYEDLHDWAKRWQAERKENTRLNDSTPVAERGTLMAGIILQAKAMNQELDSILAALTPTEAAGEQR